jgi:glc operon protein GlcG
MEMVMRSTVIANLLPALMFVFATTTAFGADALGVKHVLNLDVAKKLAAAAEAEAVKNKWNVVIALVDDGGHLVYLQRMDDTQYGSVDVATRKALTAIAFKRPSKVFEDAVASGRTGVLNLPVMPLEGGLPLTVDGKIIGAIGVSGVTSQQDGVIAKAAVDALTKSTGK